MKTQPVYGPIPNTVYTFTTQKLAGVTYVIQNRTPYLMYVTDQAVVSLADAANSQIMSIAPMDTARVGYMQGNNLNVVLAGNIAIAFGSNTATYIAVTTVGPDEEIASLQNAAAFSQYDAAAVDDVLQGVTSQVFTIVSDSTVASMDLTGWGGFYFEWTPPLSVTGTFLIVTIEGSTDNINWIQITRAMASGGYMAMPKSVRYMRIRCKAAYMDATLNAALTFGVSVARVSKPIDPVISLREDTFPNNVIISLAAGTQGTINLPANGGKTRIRLGATGIVAAPTIAFVARVSRNLSCIRMTRNAFDYEYIFPSDAEVPASVVILSNADTRTITCSYDTCERVDV